MIASNGSGAPHVYVTALPASSSVPPPPPPINAATTTPAPPEGPSILTPLPSDGPAWTNNAQQAVLAEHMMSLLQDKSDLEPPLTPREPPPDLVLIRNACRELRNGVADIASTLRFAEERGEDLLLDEVQALRVTMDLATFSITEIIKAIEGRLPFWQREATPKL